MRVFIAVALIFMLGLIFYTRYGGGDLKETLINKPRCPNILIQKGNQIILQNTSLAEVPGVNPITFDNLEEYAQFVKWQRSQGIECPVLYLRNSYDAQGNEVFAARPCPENPQGGLSPSLPSLAYQPPVTMLYDAGRDDPPYNQNSYPSYDPDNQYIGDYTPLDKMFHSQQGVGKVSDYATDSNWGGDSVTQGAVDAGVYTPDEVWVRKRS